MRSTWHGLAMICSVVLISSIAGCGGGADEKAPVAAIDNPEQAAEGASAQAPAEPTMDAKHPVVEFNTSMGKITLELDGEKAPLTVDNFLNYVQQGHYDGTIIDQVYANQGILGGLFTPELVEKPTRTPIRNEADNGVKNSRGTIAMVRAADAIDSAAAQFFINVRDNPALDHQDRSVEGFGYCVFGQVTAGLDVVDRIAEVQVQQTDQFDQAPVQTVMIESARRVR